ncbi:PCNA-associated factor [Orussus abietinus]|uniref:PCNA-associated factor n=1 Tax=Orussus abietinus TaxID=222816 RepID=UPI0006261A29|nr:PCNA-associated factor [Orussus abietinus]
MVRTKATSLTVRTSGGKAPRKFTAAAPMSVSNGAQSKTYSGGNPYHPRETPNWQKPITTFFNQPFTNSDGALSSTGINDTLHSKHSDAGPSCSNQVSSSKEQVDYESQVTDNETENKAGSEPENETEMEKQR